MRSSASSAIAKPKVPLTVPLRPKLLSHARVCEARGLRYQNSPPQVEPPRRGQADGIQGGEPGERSTDPARRGDGLADCAGQVEAAEGTHSARDTKGGG